MNLSKPEIIEQTSDYSVVFKPPKMHSVKNARVPNKQKNGDTLIEWYEESGLADNELPESGLMHRLDYETHGLVLFAKNQKSYEYFKTLQDKGEFVKEYSAVCLDKTDSPRIIMSYFRPFGPGRKQVRPETEAKKYHEIAKDKGGFYRTEIISVAPCEQGFIFTVRIKRGFRHQIRSHLSWIGCPILNDPVYNPAAPTREEIYLALRAHALFFADPSTGEKKECRIEKIVI